MLTSCRQRLIQRKLFWSTASALHLRSLNKNTAISETSKEYPAAPNVGIGVVILRRVAQGEQVLLVRRGKEPQKGMLTFPGGSLELGETMADCAIRETLEETGLRLKNEGMQKSLAQIRLRQGSAGHNISHRSLTSPRPVDADDKLPLRIVHTVDSIHRDKEGKIQYHYTIVDLAAIPEDLEAEPHAADDVDEVFWAPVSSLQHMPDLGDHCARIAEEAVQRFDI